RYTKDGSVNSREDRAVVDDIGLEGVEVCPFFAPPPEGILQDLPEAEVLATGWRPCFAGPYNGVTAIDPILAGCQGEQMMLACRPVGAANFTLAAAGQTAEITRNIGDGVDAVNPHNGVNFYFSPTRSWGFAPIDLPVNRNSCDF
ncbi:MAG: hypothetical protein KC613_09665, partial [Myxococcales bacterium]|nr:hypothetical protein [Myxococcales bacterium]